MNRFTATNVSEAIVASDLRPIWDALTDPVLLPQLTPLLKSIDADGDLWRWHLVSIAALGVSISPCFTERMTFKDGQRIDFTHRPPAGVREHAGAEGHYVLTEVDGGTRLRISLTLCVELPLPKLASPAVTRVMAATMQRTGERFSAGSHEEREDLAAQAQREDRLEDGRDDDGEQQQLRHAVRAEGEVGHHSGRGQGGADALREALRRPRNESSRAEPGSDGPRRQLTQWAERRSGEDPGQKARGDEGRQSQPRGVHQRCEHGHGAQQRDARGHAAGGQLVDRVGEMKKIAHGTETTVP
jgi:hypothetical protein